MKCRYTIVYVPSVPDALSFYKAAFGIEKSMVFQVITPAQA